jgi:Tfp pilus assembly protein PilX
MNLDILRRSLRDMKRSARQAEREFNEALTDAADGAFVFNRADRIARRQCHAVKLRLRGDSGERPESRTRLSVAVRRVEMEVFA